MGKGLLEGANSVLEIEKQMLTLVFDTKYANRLEADLMNLSKVIRFKMVKV